MPANDLLWHMLTSHPVITAVGVVGYLMFIVVVWVALWGVTPAGG